MSLAHSNSASIKEGAPFRVMVVDDSAVIRGLLSRILESDPMVDVVVTAANGEQAVRLLPDYDVEVVVLDIEMPVMDGLAALPKLLAINPQLKVIMASTLTQRNAQISFKALAAGATDYIPKPTASRDINEGKDFHRNLCDKVRALGMAYRCGAKGRVSRLVPGAVGGASSSGRAPGLTGAVPVRGSLPVTLRKTAGKQAEVIVIGSSTGGPQALLTLLKDFDRNTRLPIIITQHMPATFTAILAEHVARASGRPCAEGVDGQIIEAGKIYIAPGDWHMVIESGPSGKVLRLNQNPPVNFCRPAVDPLFMSAAAAYEGRVLAVVLTGMGQDGLEGGRRIVEVGGTVIAQDEATSVVWGMPGAVSNAGICNAVLPLEKLIGFIRDFPKRVV